MGIELKAQLQCDECGNVTVDVLAKVELSACGVAVDCDTPDGWHCSWESGYGNGGRYVRMCPACVTGREG